MLAMRAKTKPGRQTPDDDAEPAPVRALSDSTIRQTYTILRAGLDGAVRDGLIARNPAVLVTRPGVERQRGQALGRERCRCGPRAAEASRYHTVLVLIAATGLRKGEALALPWDTNIVNLDEGWLKVRKTWDASATSSWSPSRKTDRSRRTVPLSPRRRSRCCGSTAPSRLAERLRAGDQWQDSG